MGVKTNIFSSCLVFGEREEIGKSFLLERMTAGQSSFQTWWSGGVFSKITKMSLSSSNNWKHLLLVIKYNLSNKNFIFWKTYTNHPKFESFPILKTFWMGLVTLMNVGFWHCLINCVSIWKFCITWWTNIFSNDKCIMLQNHALVKDLLKVQDRLIDFNVSEKYIDVVSNSKLKLSLRNYHCWVIYIFVKPDFCIYDIQNNILQWIECRSRICLFLSQISRDLKNWNTCHFFSLCLLVLVNIVIL